MYEGEGRPDDNFKKPISREGESDNFQEPTVSPEGAQNISQPQTEVNFDDPRVRSLMDNEGLTAEEAIMRVKGGQAELDRSIE